ncbi:YHS domain-containing (seleno)protein [uncultured Ruegeria sp.]|uniref:YHS domain-containing (seleno)protein n=1 Tax=uncultured Ruegeria sp. TaxID=259304 RepID=UPI0026372690|nr:YHS domain-containing (seleno)protein [uncultured Ruegeria sp.]
MFYTANGLAVSGYDAVTYFKIGTPMPGKPDISLMWKGAVWRFASEENRDRFERNPRAFAPQFGGYCAYAMVQGLLSSTDPRAWQIVDGKLYLTHSATIERVWKQNVSQNIREAEGHWPQVLYH